MKEFVAAHEASVEAFAPAADSTYRRYGKRAFDIILALLLLPLLAPVIGVLWVLTKRDGGPGFYAQTRVGKDGRLFKCWKIRSMVVGAEKVLDDLCSSDPAIAEEWRRDQKLDNDPRITQLGCFVRRTSLDELPQIWNVLRGDMSFIGPRPFMVSQERLYSTAGGRAYFRMRPGISGPWQVDNRGALATDGFMQRVAYDERYLREQSIFNDLRLVWKTLGVIAKRTGK